MRSFFLLAGASAVLALGCAAEPPPDTTSTVRGQLVASTYAAAPSSVIAVNESSKRITSSVNAAGGFSISLEKGHTYKLLVAHAAGEESMVFPRASGRLDTTFHVAGGAAVVDLGGVRHFESAPPTGFVVFSSGTATSTDGTVGEGELGECVDGFIMGTGEACADDDGQVACEEGDDEGEDGAEAEDGDAIECENGLDPAGQACVDEPDPNDPDDIQCADGIDPNGQPCVDDDDGAEEEDDADPAGQMSVPDHNPPDVIGGCDEGGEQEGEHED